MPWKRVIIHMDMDAFYPSVEVLDRPQLRGRPVIVGGTGRRGVVSSASYEARRFGIHSAQPMAEARRRCPKGVFLSVRMSRYREVSRAVFSIFRRFTPLVEGLSIDEAFLDVTGSQRLWGEGAAIARAIKKAIRRETGLTASAGVAPSKFVAKIASDLRKPDGLVVVSEQEVQAFLDPLPVEAMWGVGPAIRKALAAMGIRSFAELRMTPMRTLEQRFGVYGRRMHELARGWDPREVVPEARARSLGHEETFEEDIWDAETARVHLLRMAQRVARRARKHGLMGRTVTLKVRYADFRLETRGATLPIPTDDGWDLFREICRLLTRTQVGGRPVRLLGVSLSRLTEGPGQLSLFAGGEDRKEALNRALDQAQDRYGEGSLAPATVLK